MVSEKTKLAVLMLMAYFFFLIGVANSYPMHTTTDELGGLAGAAHFAGLDWSGVISQSGYYGFGYYSLFFWLFKVTDSPFVIYRTIIIITAMLRILIIPIAYCILKNHLNIGSGKYLYLVSFMMPFLHTSTVGLISNEYVLELLTWIILLLMCKSVTCSGMRQSILYSILLIAVCFYSLFIHTRALTLVIALIIVYFVYGIINKYKYTIGIILGLSFICILSKRVIELYQQNVYGVTGSAVRNGYVSVSHSFSLFDKNTWDVWFRMLTGMFETENILTGGLFLTGVVVVISCLLYCFRKKRSVLSCQGNMMMGVVVLCMGATIAAFLVSSWFDGMLATWGSEEAAKEYSYKGLTYVRYWNIYVPPFLLCVFAILTKLHSKKVMHISVIVMVVCHIFFMNNLLPLVKLNSSCASFLFGIGHYSESFRVSEEYYLKCIAISLLIALTAYLITQMKAARYAILVFIIYMMLLHFNEQTEYNFYIKQQISSKILASYNVKVKLDKMGIAMGTIYLNDETGGTDGNWKIYSVAQFYFNRYTLQTTLPEELKENDIIISTAQSDHVNALYSNTNCYVLDDNEVWYTKLDLSGIVSTLER